MINQLPDTCFYSITVEFIGGKKGRCTRWYACMACKDGHRRHVAVSVTAVDMDARVDEATHRQLCQSYRQVRHLEGPRSATYAKRNTA